MNYGYEHPRSVDIDEIRELLRGYGSEESLLKELIQNAEDANATRLQFLLYEGDPDGQHPLLRHRGLCVVNDGVFRPEHLAAMRRLRVGTKGRDAQAIGRFGKGLKSVFAVCEGFFLVASTSTKHGWESERQCHFFNPRSGWRYSSWDQQFLKFQDAIANRVEECLRPDLPSTWLALWLPLRHPDHLRDGEHSVAPIFRQERLAALNEQLAANMVSGLRRLAPSLVTLRNLQQIEIADRSSEGGAHIVWHGDASGNRPDAPGECEPRSLHGKLLLVNGTTQNQFEYFGVAGTKADARADAIRKQNDWPETLLIENDEPVDEKAKAVPHFGVFLTKSPATDGRLRIKWAVFLPVGQQPPGTQEVQFSNLGYDITVTIHGFGFLDPQRTKVDWLDSGFRPRESPTSRACFDWNKFLYEETALEYVPEVISTAATELGFSAHQAGQLAGAVRQTWLWATFSRSICRRNRWIVRWTSAGQNWCLVSADKPLLRVPFIGSLSDLSLGLPGLPSFLDRNHVVQVGGPIAGPAGLLTDAPTALSADEIETVLSGATTEPNSPGLIAWLNQLLSDHAAGGALSPALKRAIKDLRLIPVTDVQPTCQLRRHVSLADWEASGSLIFRKDGSSKLLPALQRAIPGFGCWLVDEQEVPRWLERKELDALGAGAAASIVLGSQLAIAAERIELAKNLLPNVGNLSVRSAIRYLMHGRTEHSAGDALLLLPVEGNQAVWERLIQHLVPTPPWRIISREWSGVFAANDLENLNVAPLNEEGAWSILSDHKSEWRQAAFGDDWTESDLRRVLEGLWQAGVRDRAATKHLLRRLPIHALRSDPRSRTAICNPEGQLEDSYIFDDPDFHRDIDESLLPLWSEFLTENRVIQRSESPTAATIQEQLFTVTIGAEAVVHELKWNYVLRRCLVHESPVRWVRLILRGLEHGHQHLKGIHSLMATTPWLPLAAGGVISPVRVVDLPGMSEYLYHLVEHPLDNWATERALPEWVRTAPCRQSLAEFYARGEQALGIIADWCTDKPQWRLGILPVYLPDDRSEFLRHAESLSSVRAAALVAEIVRHPYSDTRNQSAIPEEWAAKVWSALERAVCRAFEGDPESKRQQYAQILKSTANTAKKTVFNAYLKQAVHEGFNDLVSELTFCSQTREWLPAKRLTWPSANIESEFQICQDQADILEHDDINECESDGGDPAIADSGNRLATMPDFAAHAQSVVAYLRPFADGNVGPEVVAALVCVLGGNAVLTEFLRELLSRGSRQNPDDFLLDLVGEAHGAIRGRIRKTNFTFEFIAGTTLEVPSLTGEPFEVNLTRKVDTLLVGDLSNLWRRRYFDYQKDSECHLVRLRQLDDIESLANSVDVFAKTIDGIVFKVYCNGVRAACPTGIAEFLGKLHEGQTDLRRSQLYLLDGAEARILNLGLRAEPSFQVIMRDFDAAREALVQAEELRPRAGNRASQLHDEGDRKRKFANDSLEKLLMQASHPGQHALIAAIRRKMEQFQYTSASMLLELFQNADDAAVELSEMRGGSAADFDFRVSFDSASREFCIVHWGRPINQYLGPAFDGQSRGYHQDLAKMLTLNFSDKAVSRDNEPLIETGKFGLGFKTVFFLADEPEVLSGRLAFCIKGGFFPMPLPTSAIAELRAVSGSAPSKAKLTATVVRLRLNESSASSAGQLIRGFATRATLLTQFARKLRTIEVTIDGESHRYASERVELWPAAHLARTDGGGILLFDCPVPHDFHGATVAIKMGAGGMEPFAPDVPRLWVTTPLSEPSAADFALNAPLSPDAGRQRVVPSSQENQRIILAVAEGLFSHLEALDDRAIEDWPALHNSLQLSPRISLYDWWSSVWDIVGQVRTIAGNDILCQLAWAPNSGAFRRVVAKRKVAPSKLPLPYQALVNPADVSFALADLLANTSGPVFRVVSEWSSFRAQAPVGSLVGPTVLETLKAACLVGNLPLLGVREAIEWEIGAERCVGLEAAARIGRLLETCRTGAGASIAAQEHLDELLPKIAARFLSADDQWQPASHLVASLKMAGVVESDEILRAAFAPPSAVLHPSYCEFGVRTFVAARGRLSADSSTLANWARAAGSSSKWKEVFEYLIHGELGQELADELGPKWLDQAKTTNEWNVLPIEQAREIDRLFQSLISLCRYGVVPDAPLPVPADVPDEPEQVMDGHDAFRLISDWWKADGARHSEEYTRKTYPSNHPHGLPWRNESGWDLQSHPDARTDWLVLLIDGALVSLGLNRTGRNKGFLTYLIETGILTDIANCKADPQRLVKALDRYLEESSIVARHHFPMRQFISFYAASRFLDEYVDTLFECNRSMQANAFSAPFAPARAEILSGSGIRAPALSSFLGLGACQVLRELYRLDRLTNPAGFPRAYCPIRKVRRLFVQLFGQPVGDGAEASIAMHKHLDQLASELGGDATFDRAFDLPFLILAENPQLRLEVLSQDFEAEDSDELEINDAASAFIN